MTPPRTPTVVVVSFAPRASRSARRLEVVARAVDAFTRHAGVSPQRTSAGSVSLMSTEPVLRDEHARLQAVLCRGIVTVDGRRLATLPPGTIDATRYLPPFGAIVVDPAHDSVLAATDSCGLRHVYQAEGDGWAAVSTSSQVLAELADSGPDDDAIGAFALTGMLLGTTTPYRSVRKIDAGEAVELCGGRTRHRAGSETVEGTAFPSRRHAVDAGVDAVRHAVQVCLDAAPDAALELSGGLDSRMVLAGIASEDRRGREAFTIGAPNSGEVTTAATLASLCSLHHVDVDLTGLGALAPQQADELVGRASRARDHSGNALALAVLDWAERRLAAQPRLNGQNGEFARGFFYPAQRDWRTPSDRLAAQLVRWRLLTNDRVDPWLLSQEFEHDSRRYVIDHVTQAFADSPLTWLQATDEYYLRQRMQRWLGAAYSTACMSRLVLPPFFHPAFITWARRASVRDKRNSRLFAQVLTALAPELADPPLSDRPAPRRLAYPNARDRLDRLAETGAKVKGKVQQRVSGAGKPPTGATALARAQVTHWIESPGRLERLRGCGYLDPRAIDGILRRERTPSPASIAFLVALLGIREFGTIPVRGGAAFNLSHSSTVGS